MGKFISDTFQSIYQKVRESHFSPSRERAWRALIERGLLPSKKSAPFRHLPLRKLYRFPWTISESPLPTTLGNHGPALTFIDGRFSPSLSTAPPPLISLPLEEAWASYQALLERRFTKQVECEGSPFVLLNHALYRNGLFLYLPPDQTLQQPLECLCFQTEPNLLVSPKIDLFVGKGSKMTMRLTYLQQGGDGWSNGNLHITLEEGAHLVHVEEGSGMQRGFGFQAIRAHLKKGSRFDSFAFSHRASCIYHDVQATLEGERARAALKGLHLVGERGAVHTRTLAHHLAFQTRSEQSYKMALSNDAQSTFSGKISIEKEGQKTEAYQSNHNLLLGKGAKAASQPDLEICADDVKASHGVTCSRLSEREILYIKTRGLSASQAKKQLVQGFCREFIDSLPEVWRRQITKSSESFSSEDFLQGEEKDGSEIRSSKPFRQNL